MSKLSQFRKKDEMESNVAEELRLLGHLERWSTHRHHLGWYYNAGMTARYGSSEPGKKLEKKMLFSALQEVIFQHAALGISICDEGMPQTYFVRLKTINLEDVVDFRPPMKTSELDAALARESSTRFKDLGRLPAWRIVVFSYQDIEAVDVGYFFHHAVGDGCSGLAFHRALVKALNSHSDQNGSATPENWTIEVPKLPLLPSLEDLLPLPQSFWQIAKTLFGVWVGSGIPGNLWTGGPVGNFNLTTHFRHFSISPAAVSALLSRCRQEKTTMTALLQILIAKAIFFVIPESSGAGRLHCSTALNVRRFMDDIHDDNMGVFVASMQQPYDRTEIPGSGGKEFWELARKSKLALNQKIAKRNQDLNVGMISYAGDLKQFFEGKIGKKRSDSYEVSNIGVFVGQEGEWKVERVLFSQSANGLGAAIEFSVASAKDGEMCVGASWQVGVVMDWDAEDIMKRLEKELLGLAS